MRSAKFSKIVIFTVCILLVFAVAAALLFDGASLPASGNVIADSGEGADKVAEASYPVSADGYTHGSNVKNNTTAEAVNTSSAFVSAIQNNKTIRLTGSFTLSSAQVQNIWNKTYTGTIYGNGNKITVSFPTSENGISVTSSEHKAGFGGLCGKLTGAIYDLIFEHTGGQLNVRMSGNVSGFAGGLVGSIEGGTVENVKVILSNSSGGRIGLVKEGSGSGWGSKNYYVAAGALAGRISAGNIKNVTIVNNAWIEAGVTSGSGSTSVSTKTPGHVGNIAGIIGPVQEETWSGSININNIIIEGSVSSASLVGQYTANIGTLTTSTNITVNNFYNKYKNTYDSENNGSSASFAVHDCSPTLTINNQYQDSGVTTVNSTADDRVSISGTVTVGTKYSVYFDPAATTLANSLVVVQTGVAGGDTKKAILTTNSGATYGDYAFADNGSTVIMRNLPTAISNWNNNGTFACTINITQDAIQVDKLDPVNKWESSYTTKTSSTGTAVDNGSKLTTAIKNNQNIYLTSDITDFRGFTHTGEYTGTLDGNGRTIYIVSGAANSADTVGGLFKRLSGTIKNVRIVLYSSYNRTISVGSIGTGIIAGNLCGGTVDNVYVYVPSDVTFGANGGSNYESYVGAVAGLSDAGYTIKNTTVDIDGEIRLDGSYIYLSAFIGKSQSAATRYNYNFTNVTLRGSGTFDSDYSASSEPVFMGASTILFTPNGVNGSATLNIDGFINDFQGSIAAQNYSMYGILTQNQKDGELTGWTINTANVYDYDIPLADINKTTTGNKYIEITSRSTVSTTVEGSSIKVTPYFPAGDTTNLVLVAGDGTSECPFVTYESYEGMQDGNYMVVSIPKTEIAAQNNVQLTQGKSPVNEPTLATTEEELVYNGGEITIAINQLTSGTTALGEGDYTLTVTAKDGGTGSVQNNKPVNAGDYTLTVTLLNGYEFEGGTTEKTIPFTVTPFEISGTLSISTSAVYDRTEKTVIFTADDGKGLFGDDNVVISYNGGDRINVTEAGFTATATVPNANYTFVNSASSIEKTFKITAKELTVVWGETSFTYDRSEKVPTAKVTEGIIEGDSVTLSVSGAETNAGSGYTATATISPANANYALANGTIQFSIAKAKVSVSGNNATAEYKAAKYTEAEIKAAVFTNGLPDDATTNIAVSPESVINADDSATVTVTLKDGNNYEFEAGATTQFTFTVVAKEISLPEGSADNTAVYSPSTTYTAAQITELIFGTASVENVTVKVMNGDVEISGDTTVSGAGAYTVTATANENYVFVADTVTQYTFEITKAPITLSVSVEGWTYGEAANDPVITGNDGSGAVTYLYKGDGYSNAEAPTNAGTYTLTITVAETTNYQGGKASCEFTIEKAKVTVPVIEDKQYTGEKITSGLTETDDYTVQDEGGIDVGTYYATLTLKKSANYAWASGDDDNDGVIQVEYEIVAQDVHINSWTTAPSMDGWIYGQYFAETNAPVYQAAYGNDNVEIEVRLKSGSDSDYDAVEDLSTLNAGVYLMKFTVAAVIDPDGGESYTSLSAVVEFTVSKAAISVTVSIDGWTYGEAANRPTVDGNTASGAVTYSYVGTGNTAYEESETAPVNAGTYKVKATVAETTNYRGATAEKEFTIAKKAITATVSAEKATYDGIEHAATVSFDGKVGEDELTASLLYNGEAGVPVNAGSYTVTVGSYGGAAVGNYEITTAEGEVVLRISPKELNYGDFDVKYEDVNFDGVYDGKPHGAVATVKDGVLIGDDTLMVTVLYNGSEEKPVNAGEYKISLKISGNDNYMMGADDSAELEIYKATVNISGSNATAVYTGEAFKKDEIIKAVFGEADLSLVEVNISYGESAAAQYAGDKATLTLTLKDGNNYEFAAETVTTYTFTVTAGTVSLSGENATVEYRGTAYTDDEIKNAVFGEGTWEKFVITISYNNTEALNAGDIATVTVTGYSDPNYSLDPEMTTKYTFTVETFKVAAPQLTADSFVYNGEEQTVSLTDDTYVDISANVQTDKGDYKAVAALKDKANYEWTAGGSADIELAWSISAKDITLKAETSVDKTYDGDAYDFSRYVVSGADGFYARDNVIVTVSAGTTYTPGSYGITVSHDANGNYNVTVEPTDAKLTINKAVLTVTAKDAEIEYTGNIITFEFDITAGKVGEDDVQIDGVTYKQNGIAVAPQETGTYDVTFTLKGAQAAYYTANATQVKVTPQTATAPDGMTSERIVLPADDDMIYDGEAHVAILNYTATDGNKYGIIYHNGTSYVDEAVNAGEYTVHVYKNTKTNIVVGISKTMTVEKKILLSDDIKFTSGGKLSFTYSGAENVVTAIATGVKGEDVVLTTLYDGGDKAPVDAGKYTVTFASANGNYAVDESVSYEMTVAKANVNAPKANRLEYNGSEQIAFSENSLYTAGGVIAATDVSEEGYTATFTLTSDNYKWSNEGDEVREISVKWNIVPATVTITVSDAEKEKVYDGAALTPEELAALFVAPDKIGGGKVEIVVTVKDGGEVLSVGVYTVTAKLNDINYFADKAETTFTVTQATPKVTVKVQDKLLQEGDKLSTVGIYLEEGSTPGTVSWEDTELALKKGENVVTWTYVPEDTLNYTGDTGSLTLTVGDEVLTAFKMTKGPDKTEYNAFEAFDPTGIELMATFDGVHEKAVAIDECEIVVENATADGKLTAATTKVTVKYGNMSVEIAVSVAKIKVEIPALEQTEFEYTAQPHTVTVAEDPRYAIVKGNEETNVGKYNAVVSLTDKVNYEWADGLAEDRMLSWEITPVTLSGYITLPENLVYDGVAKVATFTLTKGELLGGATMNIAYELTDGTVLQGAPVDAGVYEVVATLPDTKNYRFEEGTEYCKAMTVEKKTVTIITIGSREKVYDGSEVTPEQLAEHFSATDGITVKVTASGTVLNAGTYQITATIEEKNYRAEPVSCTYTVRKASQTAKADISVGYLKVEITAADETAIVEYSEDGNVWKTLDGAITVGLKATYSYYVRYAESANYNASAAVKVEGNITKAALMQYVEERFTGDITLADAADVAKLEELAKSAEGQNADFDKALESLSAQREELVNGATSAVEKALKAGGALKGYAAAATALAITVGGISAAAAVGLMIGKGKGGRKNEEK